MAFIKETQTKPAGLTIGEILDRFAALNAVKNLPEKLHYARRRNLMKLREFEYRYSAKRKIPETEAFQEYNKKFNELRSQYLLTDEAGKTIMQKSFDEAGSEILVPVVDVANKALGKASDELKEKYKEAIKERETDIKLYHEMMDEIVPVAEIPEVYSVDAKFAEGLSQEQYDAVYWFLKD